MCTFAAEEVEVEPCPTDVGIEIPFQRVSERVSSAGVCQMEITMVRHTPAFCKVRSKWAKALF